MKAKIDRDGCIACGFCVSVCPNVFRFADDGFAEVYVDEVPEEDEDNAIEAQEGCPTSVITVEEED
ncbi:MAG TPA: ferredoxin [Bacillota bacterium]|nr:ferredoxin [Clostridiales bacterium]HOQ14849.1 ferredoxin [Bacillota bacterium]